NNASLNIIGGSEPFTNTIHSLNPQAGCAGVVSISGAPGTRFNLEGTATCGIGVGETLDLRIQEGTELNMSLANYDGADMLNSRMTFDHGSAFVTKVAWNNGAIIPFTAATSGWDSATARHTDVTDTTPSAVPADALVRTLRFNDPAAAQLTLQGDLSLANGAILVTAAMGANETVIQGGTLTSGQNNELVVHQYNTQAVLRISSILTNTPAGSSLVLTKSGPGTLVLEDVPNTFSGTIYVLGGVLEVASAQAYGATNRVAYVYNGSTLRLRGETFLGVKGSNCIYCNEAGGTVDVPDATDHVFLRGRPGMQTHALFTKTGKGMLSLDGDWTTLSNESFLGIPSWFFSLEDGTVSIHGNAKGPMNFNGENTVTVRVKNNTVLRGADFLKGVSMNNGGGAVEDEQGSYHLYVGETGAVVDLYGVSIDMGRSGQAGVRSIDFISGPGRLTITNSLETAATASFAGAHFNRFTGIFDGAAYFLRSGYGGGVPVGEFTVPEGTEIDFGRAYFPYVTAIGRLTGAGRFGGDNAANSHATPPLLVGRDAEETFESPGHLWGTYYSTSYKAFPFRYTKVGSNLWRISGATNDIIGPVTVRKGGILVAADSPGQGAVGALGTGQVVLGEAQSGSGPASLLTDGPYTVGNALAFAETAAAVTVGGNQTAGASLFTSDLTLTRDVCLHAENADSPNGVTFSGAVTGPGGIIKTGPGTVYLTGAVQHAGPNTVVEGTLEIGGNLSVTNTLTVAAGSAGGGVLAVAGDLTLGDGAVIAVSVTGELVRGQSYTLLTWTGTRTGTFAPVSGLPDGWHVGYDADRVILYYAPPGTLIKLL
ncbi:MAG: autotransporter-associated beta strand repeat-containing protein, partial [Kiritimatiellia bacterium]|nr:autotransporter-associated beta strand repeat-containing protein [Kiritimatiellia bacterium]